MYSAPENSSRYLLTFEDFYDYSINVSHNDTGEFFQVMGLSEICHPYSGFIQTLKTFYIPIIIIVGILGNFLSFLVLLTTHLKLRSSSYYLAALAVSDSGFLFVVFIVYCSFNEIFELFNKEGFCQIFVYISSVCAFLSVWLTVAFTTERFIAVRFPLRRQYICTVSRAKLIVLGLSLVALFSQLHLFWVAGIISHNDKKECDMNPHYWLLANIINFLDTFVTLIIPVALIIVMNVMIARVIFKSHHLGVHDDERLSSERVVLKYHVSAQSSDSTRNSEQEFLSTRSKRSVKHEDHLLRRNRQTKASSIQVQQNINKMLLVISSVFVALNFPSYFLRISVFYGFTLMERNPPEYIWCAQQFTMLLYYTNFSINFLLYAMCGKSFRLCLKKMFRGFYPKCLS